jgi:hypothetical protein
MFGDMNELLNPALNLVFPAGPAWVDVQTAILAVPADERNAYFSQMREDHWMQASYNYMKQLYVAGLREPTRTEMLKKDLQELNWQAVITEVSLLDDLNHLSRSRFAAVETTTKVDAMKRGKPVRRSGGNQGGNGRASNPPGPCRFCQAPNHSQYTCQRRINEGKPCVDGTGKPYAAGSIMFKKAKKAETEYLQKKGGASSNAITQAPPARITSSGWGCSAIAATPIDETFVNENGEIDQADKAPGQMHRRGRPNPFRQQYARIVNYDHLGFTKWNPSFQKVPTPSEDDYWVEDWVYDPQRFYQPPYPAHFGPQPGPFEPQRAWTRAEIDAGLKTKAIKRELLRLQENRAIDHKKDLQRLALSKKLTDLKALRAPKN